MVTHSKVGIIKSNPKFSFHVSAPSPIPRSHTYALRGPHWQHVMLDEYNALISNGTYKVRLVANGHSQQQGIDCDETFSPVVKLATIRTVLSLAISRHWPIHQLDVKNAFLHRHLTETVYMHQPLGFVDPAHPNHSKYAREVLEQAGMLNCNASSTPVATESKLGPDGDPGSDPTLYRSLAGSLQYLTFTRPDISYAVQHLIRMPTGPVAPPLGALPPVNVFSSATTLFHGPLSANTLSLARVPKRSIVCRQRCRETAWVRNLIRELHVPLRTATLVYCDNVSVVYLSSNPVQHQCTKHIEIDIHFVKDLVATGHVRVLHVPSRYQFADIFTKGLPSSLFAEFRSSLSVRSSPAPIAGEF
nr:ribonuclease H-like domain-containing protein [Tanacetum cinerariifolium]